MVKESKFRRQRCSVHSRWKKRVRCRERSCLNGAVYSAALALTPQHVVDRKDGKTGSRRALRARAGSRRGRRGRPVLQEPVLGAADSERRNCPGVRGVLSEVPEASMSAAASRGSPLPDAPKIAIIT